MRPRLSRPLAGLAGCSSPSLSSARICGSHRRRCRGLPSRGEWRPQPGRRCSAAPGTPRPAHGRGWPAGCTCRPPCSPEPSRSSAPGRGRPARRSTRLPLLTRRLAKVHTSSTRHAAPWRCAGRCRSPCYGRWRRAACSPTPPGSGSRPPAKRRCRRARWSRTDTGPCHPHRRCASRWAASAVMKNHPATAQRARSFEVRPRTRPPAG